MGRRPLPSTTQFESALADVLSPKEMLECKEPILKHAYCPGRGWAEWKVRRKPDDTLMRGGVWGGKQSYIRDLPYYHKRGLLEKEVDRHFTRWQLKSGDTWHIDVLCCTFSRESHRRDGQSTFGEDVDARMATYDCPLSEPF